MISDHEMVDVKSFLQITFKSMGHILGVGGCGGRIHRGSHWYPSWGDSKICQRECVHVINEHVVDHLIGNIFSWPKGAPGPVGQWVCVWGG